MCVDACNNKCLCSLLACAPGHFIIKGSLQHVQGRPFLQGIIPQVHGLSYTGPSPCTSVIHLSLYGAVRRLSGVPCLAVCAIPACWCLANAWRNFMLDLGDCALLRCCKRQLHDSVHFGGCFLAASGMCGSHDCAPASSHARGTNTCTRAPPLPYTHKDYRRLGLLVDNLWHICCVS